MSTRDRQRWTGCSAVLVPVHTDGSSAATHAEELRRLEPAASVKRPIMWHNQIKGAGGRGVRNAVCRYHSSKVCVCVCVEVEVIHDTVVLITNFTEY